jgi:tetratricopeptide (TPR) repeat protein
MSFGVFSFLFGTLVVGIGCCRLGRYRDRLTLPIPEFTTLKAAWQNRPKVKDEEVKAIETELQNRVAGISKKSKQELELASAAYDALVRCDFVRAHIAADLCLRTNKKSIEGAIALAVSAGYFGQNQQVGDALRFLLQTTGLKSPSTIWAAGWALWLCGDWGPAEAFLEKISRQKPTHPTVLIGLAICQSNRGKLQSALLLAREACSRPEMHVEHSKFLLDLLFQAGYLREAREQLARLKSSIDDDVDLILMMVRLNLMSKNLAAAGQWTETLKHKGPAPHLTLRLAYLYEVARQREKAAAYYQEALTNGFYPEGLIGLARLETQTQNKEQARLHLLSALNTERTLGEKAIGPLPLFHQILGQLAALEAPVPECRAWVATLNGGKSPPGLEKKSLLIYAVTRQQAEASLNKLFAAMQPTTPPPPPTAIGWTDARKELQPDGPVFPGVQGVMN